MKLRDKISWISWFTKTFSIFCFAIRKVLENICILKTNLLEISLWNSCVNGIPTSVDTCNTLCRKCTLMRILYYIQTTRRWQYKRKERDCGTRGWETCQRYIWRRYCAGATRGASFARSMHHRSALGRIVSGWVHPPHTMQHSTRANARALVPRTYNKQHGLLDARGMDARVRCNKGDNGHYDRRVTSLETANPPSPDKRASNFVREISIRNAANPQMSRRDIRENNFIRRYVTCDFLTYSMTKLFKKI